MQNVLIAMRMNEALFNVADENRKLSDQIKATGLQDNDLKKELKTKEKQIKELKEKFSKELSQKKKELEKASAEVKKKEKELAQSEENLGEAEKAATAAQQKVLKLKREVDSVKAQMDRSLTLAREEAEARVKDISMYATRELTTANNAKNQLQKELDSTNEQLKKAKEELETQKKIATEEFEKQKRAAAGELERQKKAAAEELQRQRKAADEELALLKKAADGELERLGKAIDEAYDEGVDNTTFNLFYTVWLNHPELDYIRVFGGGAPEMIEEFKQLEAKKATSQNQEPEQATVQAAATVELEEPPAPNQTDQPLNSSPQLKKVDA